MAAPEVPVHQGPMVQMAEILLLMGSSQMAEVVVLPIRIQAVWQMGMLPAAEREELVAQHKVAGPGAPTEMPVEVTREPVSRTIAHLAVAVVVLAVWAEMGSQTRPAGLEALVSQTLILELLPTIRGAAAEVLMQGGVLAVLAAGAMAGH